MTTEQTETDEHRAAADATGGTTTTRRSRRSTGFFTGMLFVTLSGWVRRRSSGCCSTYDTAEELFPLVLVSLVVPIGLLIARATRRFGMFMFLGMVVTALVVLGVASLVLYYMVKHDA